MEENANAAVVSVILSIITLYLRPKVAVIKFVIFSCYVKLAMKAKAKIVVVKYIIKD
jgi:hypothetical protein